MSAKTLKEKKAIAARRSRVVRTVHQFLIVAFLAVYPTLVTLTDFGALKAALPSLAFVALGAIVTDIYNRVRPA